MKKIIIGAITLVFLGIVVGVLFITPNKTVEKDQLNYVLQPLSVKDKVYDITTYNNKDYLLTDLGIANYEDNQLKYIYKGPCSQYSNLAVSEGNLIVANSKERIFEIINKDGKEIERFSWDVLRDYHVTDIKKIIYKNEYLWILASTGEDGKDILLKMDIHNKDISVILQQAMYSFDFISEENLVIVSQNSETYVYILYIYNIETEKQSKVLLESKTDIWNVKYESNRNKILFCSYKGLFECDLQGRDYKVYINNTYDEDEKRVNVFGVGEVMLISASEQLSTLQPIPKTSSVELVFLGNKEYGVHDTFSFDAKMMHAIRELRKKDSTLEVSVLPVENYDETVVKKLLAKDKDFDIMEINISELYKLQTNALKSMNDYPLAQEVMDNMFEGIKNAHIKDGEIIGIPHMQYLLCWDTNSRLVDALDFKPEESLSWTWDDFIMQSGQHRKDINNDGQIDIWLTDWTAMNILDYIYEASHYTQKLSKEEWEDILVKLKKAEDMGVIINRQQKLNLNYEEQVILSNASVTKYPKEGYEGDYILFPNYRKDKPCYTLKGTMYCINAYSKNADIAMELLCRSVQPEYYIPSTSGMIHKSREWYNEYEDKDSSAHLGGQIDLSNQQFSRYEYGYNHAIPKAASMHDKPLYDLVAAYFEGEVEVEQVSAELVK